MRLSLSSVGPSTKVITAGESDRQISCVVDDDMGEGVRTRSSHFHINHPPPHTPHPVAGSTPRFYRALCRQGRWGQGKRGRDCARLPPPTTCPQNPHLAKPIQQSGPYQPSESPALSCDLIIRVTSNLVEHLTQCQVLFSLDPQNDLVQ